ncbi:hypothetical protein BRADI_2g04313v3 [Brachypodium distachyon]|uniref:Uncharacterized protein n=1 Tax=Brachypodium distachyon TaxID=15368 RepID=A0A2K2D6X0_BRADI|nr:hypothetical protein BRADI_2g04313v3 [Brachypodium distachyon]
MPDRSRGLLPALLAILRSLGCSGATRTARACHRPTPLVAWYAIVRQLHTGEYACAELARRGQPDGARTSRPRLRRCSWACLGRKERVSVANGDSAKASLGQDAQHRPHEPSWPARESHKGPGLRYPVQSLYPVVSCSWITGYAMLTGFNFNQVDRRAWSLAGVRVVVQGGLVGAQGPGSTGARRFNGPRSHAPVWYYFSFFWCTGPGPRGFHPLGLCSRLFQTVVYRLAKLTLGALGRDWPIDRSPRHILS